MKIKLKDYLLLDNRKTKTLSTPKLRSGPPVDPSLGQSKSRLMSSVGSGYSAMINAARTFVNERSEHLYQAADSLDTLVSRALSNDLTIEEAKELSTSSLIDDAGVVHQFYVDEVNSKLLLVEGNSTSEVGNFNLESTKIEITDDGARVLDNFQEASDLVCSDSSTFLSYLVDVMTASGLSDQNYAAVISTGLSSPSSQVKNFASGLSSLSQEAAGTYVLRTLATSLEEAGEVEYDTDANAFSFDEYTPTTVKNVLISAWEIISSAVDVIGTISMVVFTGVGKVVAGLAYVIGKAALKIFESVENTTLPSYGTGAYNEFSNGSLFKGSLANSDAANNYVDSRFDSVFGSIMCQKALPQDDILKFGALIYPKCNNLKQLKPFNYGKSFLIEGSSRSIYSADDVYYVQQHSNSSELNCPVSLLPLATDPYVYDSSMIEAISDSRYYDQYGDYVEAHKVMQIYRNNAYTAFQIARQVIIDYLNEGVSPLRDLDWSGINRLVDPEKFFSSSNSRRVTLCISNIALAVASSGWSSSQKRGFLALYTAIVGYEPMGTLPTNANSLINLKNNLNELTWTALIADLQASDLNPFDPNYCSIEMLVWNWLLITCVRGEQVSGTYYGISYADPASYNNMVNRVANSEILKHRISKAIYEICHGYSDNIPLYSLSFSMDDHTWGATIASRMTGSHGYVDGTIGEDPEVISDPSVTPPSVNKRSLILTLAITFVVAAAITTAAMIMKKKHRVKQLAKASKREAEAVSANEAYLSDPSAANAKTLYKKQRRFQRYANRVGYSSNSMASFNSSTGTVVSDAGNISSLTDLVNSQNGDDSIIIPLLKIITGQDSLPHD